MNLSLEGTRGLRIGLMFWWLIAHAVTPALAATPADNELLAFDIGFWFGAAESGEIIGLSPDPVVSRTGETSNFGANLALKHTAPVLTIPPNQNFQPDSAGLCGLNYRFPRQQAEYENVLGFWDFTPLPTDWGTFGAPDILHLDSQVNLSVGGILPTSADSESPDYIRELPAGNHQITWLAETQISDLWDIAVPTAQLAAGLVSETRKGGLIGAKAAGANVTKARSIRNNLFRVVNNLIATGAIRAASLIENGRIVDNRSTAFNRGVQNLKVWDVHPPYYTDADSGAVIQQQTITIEATDFGGARFSRDRVRDALTSEFVAVDDCGRLLSLRADSPPSLLPINDSGTEVDWLIQDDGPYQRSAWQGRLAANQNFLTDTSELIRTRLVQTVHVVDTQPPLLVVPDGFARYADAPLTVGQDDFELGPVRVADLADPNPVVDRRNLATGEAPTTLGFGRHFIEYTATDFSGNATVAPADEPQRYTQIVTIKQPDSNTPPTTVDVSEQGTTAEPVTFTLTGQDVDIDDVYGIADPLAFRLVERPQHGTFRAPPLPYFIEDFRVQPDRLPDGSGPDDLPCLESPERNSGPALEAQLGLLDPNDHDEYIQRCYCDLSGSDREIPRDFVYQPNYVHVKDNGEYIVADRPLECEALVDDGIADNPRFGRWRDGELLAERQLIDLGPTRPFEIDIEGRIWWTEVNNASGVDRELYLNTLDENLEPWVERNGNLVTEVLEVNSDSNPDGIINASNLIFAVPDIERELIYVNDKQRIYVFDLFGTNERTAIGELLDGRRVLNVCQADGNNRLGFTMTLDSEGNLYVADSCDGRIHQFEPSQIDGDGTFVPGAYVGWLGRCEDNLSVNGVPFGNCDVTNQISNGFQCTDDTCSRAQVTGSGPGQFDLILHMNIDSNDTLYVADTNNNRIQRFSQGGVFAGQAISTSDGVTQDGSFVLGNMGPPRHVSVNSDAFHVLETQPGTGDFFLHVFRSSPFYDVTASSARLDYVSNANYRGDDSFQFLVDDGIDVSAIATGAVSLSRNFRAPERLTATCYADYVAEELAGERACELNEGGDIVVQLVSQDPDGFVSSEDPNGLDEHTIRIETQPENGTLELLDTRVNQAIYRYTPQQYFNGSDEFTFQANDGRFDAGEPGLASITVRSIQDPVQINFEENIRFPRGFSQAISVEFFDPDERTDEGLTTLSWDWGDGVVADPDNSPPWLGIGIRDEDQQPINPQRDGSPGRGLLVGAHTYLVPNQQIEICMIETETDIQVCELSPPIELVPVTQVTTQRLNDVPIQPERVETLLLRVENESPVDGLGIDVPSGEVAVTLPAGVTAVQPLPTGCAGDDVVTCVVNLGVGMSIEIPLQVRFDLDQALVSPFFNFDIEIAGDQPLDAPNALTLIVEASDRDGDAVIDAVDEFPDDVRYSTDNDGDGMADEWEIDFGLDPHNAADAMQDPDGDSFDNLEEFQYEGSPHLADALLASQQIASGEAVEDQLGYAMASADVNGDGFQDAVFTAPTLGASGAVFVHLGGPQGISDEATRLNGDWTGYGLSVAAGDVNSDGFGDVVVGANGLALLYLGGVDGMETSVEQTIVTSINNAVPALLLADMDGDDQLDLVAGDTRGGMADAGRVGIFLAADVYWEGPDPQPRLQVIGEQDGDRLGQSLAAVDLDGDTQLDLLVGATTGTGFVNGYFGSGFNWMQPTRAAIDFRLQGEAAGDQFGFSLSANGDLDGDAQPDVVVGAYLAGASGAVYVYGSAQTQWAGMPVFSQRIDGVQAGEQFGVRAGIFSARGARTSADLLVGANRSEQGDDPDEGTFSFFTGGELPLDTPTETYGSSFNMLGYYVLDAGDINGDGIADALVSAPDISVDDRVSDGGYVRVFLGGGANTQQDRDGDSVADELDNCPDTFNTNQADQDGDGSGDVCDVEPDTDGDGVPDNEDAFPEDARYQSDSDADGLPNAYENEFGLNPMDAADAVQDLDGDGRSNLAEFRQGSDITVDDVPPLLTIPSTVQVNAIGPLTLVSLGEATAQDALDGALTPMNDAPSAFTSGAHLVTWFVQDNAGNRSESQQLIEVTPMIELVGTVQQLAEGRVVRVAVELSGPAVSYPVTVGYDLSGSAQSGSDYAVSQASFVIDSGEIGFVEFALLEDGLDEADEVIEIALTSPVNAILGSNAQQHVEIVGGNIPPQLTLSVTQNGLPVAEGYRDGGEMQIQLGIEDGNLDATHSISWLETDNALVPSEGYTANTFTFDPMSVNAGLFQVVSRVVDNADPLQTYQISQLLRIADTAPVLSDSQDTDDDGVADTLDGLGDTNRNGLPGYQDSVNKPHHLNVLNGTGVLIQSDVGTRLRVGSTGYASGNGPRITSAEVEAFGDQGGPAVNAQDTADYPGGIFDFRISNIGEPGRSVSVVLPQQAGIPDNAVYRKFVAATGWQDFVQDANNRIASAPGEAGVCPAPGSPSYVQGLAVGDYCVQLMLQDGGPNDIDGLIDGVLSDPGGVASVPTPLAVSGSRISTADLTVRDGAQNVVMLRFSLTTSTTAGLLESMTLQASGSGDDMTDIEDVSLWLDTNQDGQLDAGDNLIGQGRFSVDNGTLTLVATSPIALPMGQSEFLVTYNF